MRSKEKTKRVNEREKNVIDTEVVQKNRKSEVCEPTLFEQEATALHEPRVGSSEAVRRPETQAKPETKPESFGPTATSTGSK
jgi:hypothetical protein